MSLSIACLPGAEQFAEALGLPLLDLQQDVFPDGETYVRCLSDVSGQSVAVLVQLNHPDPQLMRMILTAKTLSSLGARRVGLIAPYLPYLRQDVAFKPGEAVSAHYFGELLSSMFDWLVTVDPHLHRLNCLSDVLSIPAIAASSARPMSRWISKNVEQPILIGPDSESRQWLEKVSSELNDVPFHIFEKKRLDSWTVEVTTEERLQIEDRTPVVIDDIVSTGATVLRLLEQLQLVTSRPAACCITHGLFRGQVWNRLHHAFDGQVASTNSIAGPWAKIDVANEVRQAAMALAD